MRFLKEVDVKEKTVLLRADLNVPKEQDKIVDFTRLEAILPSLFFLKDQGAKILLMSHFGRPKDKNPYFSLRFLLPYLEEKLAQKIVFLEDPFALGLAEKIKNAEKGTIFLLENLRFFEGETKNDLQFAQVLASLGQVFIQEAFGAVHRAHASTVALPSLMKEKGAGFLLEKEIDYLSKLFSPNRPLVAVIGGSKISSKIGILEVLIDLADKILIGGGMAATFSWALGAEIGDSLVEEECLDLARELLKKAGDKIVLPTALLCGDTFEKNAKTNVFVAKKIPKPYRAMDIAPECFEVYATVLQTAKTILWNGPMGVFEFPNFAKGTHFIAQKIAECTKNGACSVIGGGDSLAAIEQLSLSAQMSYCSTGGGAMLEFIEKKGELPGILALS